MRKILGYLDSIFAALVMLVISLSGGFILHAQSVPTMVQKNKTEPDVAQALADDRVKDLEAQVRALKAQQVAPRQPTLAEQKTEVAKSLKAAREILGGGCVEAGGKVRSVVLAQSVQGRTVQVECGF